MMKQSFTRLGVLILFSCLCSVFLHAQVVTDERLFSFEEPQVPGLHYECPFPTFRLRYTL